MKIGIIETTCMALIPPVAEMFVVASRGYDDNVGKAGGKIVRERNVMYLWCATMTIAVRSGFEQENPYVQALYIIVEGVILWKSAKSIKNLYEATIAGKNAVSTCKRLLHPQNTTICRFYRDVFNKAINVFNF